MTEQYHDPRDEEREPPAPSPLGAEALRLVAAVQDWARRTFPEAERAPDGHTGPECQWCPLCQFAAVLRGERPEVTERVAEAGAAIASAFRALVDAARTQAEEQTEHQAEQRAADDPSTPPRVQRIDLDGPDESGAG